MAQSGQIENVKYDTGAGRLFIADNDEVPGGSIVQAETNPLTGRVEFSEDIASSSDAADASTKAVRDSFYAIPKSSATSRQSGAKVVDIATASITVTGSAVQRTTTSIVNSAAALRVMPTGNVDIVGLNYTTPATEFSIGFWAWKPTHSPLLPLGIAVITL